MEIEENTVIVVGSGFSGSVIARELAEKNMKVILIEEKNAIAGSMLETTIDGVLVHKYGPHIFHTNEKCVVEYLSKFSELIPYRHKVVGVIDNSIVPIPINFKSLDILFDKNTAENIKYRLTHVYGLESRIFVFDLLNSDEFKWLGEFIFEKVFRFYSKKQWGFNIEDLDKDVIKRVPVVIGYNDEYFDDKYQFIPKYGYNNLFENLLNHKNISIELNTKAEDVLTFKNNKTILYKGIPFKGKVFFTGAIDRLFNYRYGSLNYRTIDFVFESHNIPCYQQCAVTNYPCSENYTRISEFKYLTKQKTENTCILKEYPRDMLKPNDIPFYPINNTKNAKTYEQYYNYSLRFPQLFLCGRLAEYKYYNMDTVIKNALNLINSLY